MSWHRTVAGSVVRRVDLTTPWAPEVVPRSSWSHGDVVVVEVAAPPLHDRGVELVDGRMGALAVGDRVVGALGRRHATLEVVGSWDDVGDDGRLHLLTAAGLLGRATSVSTVINPPVEVAYVGHAVRDGRRLHLDDVVPAGPGTPLVAPVVLLVGTSMASGKTVAGTVVVQLLKRRGHRVVGAKLTGAGRYRDVLALLDAGADAVFDFVDVGLPSTVVDPVDYAARLEVLLGLIADEAPDVVVAEAGASPLEPYCGDVAMTVLGSRVACTILSASDPYAVAGVVDGFGREADLVAGPAAATSAGVELIGRLTGLPACNLLDPASTARLEALLDDVGLLAPARGQGSS